MSIVDDKYKELIEDIHKNGVWDKNESVRTVYEDGTPAYTKSIFGKQVVFEEGEIPLLTTKHVGWKTAFKEMRLFWILQTVKKEDFEKENVKVWDEWFLDDGSLGKSYAYQFESRPKKEIITVKSTVKEKHPTKLENIKVSDLLEVDESKKNKSKYIGTTINTKDYGEYIILDYFSGVSPKFLIQFLNTGYIKEISAGTVIARKNTVDIYHRYYFGVGYAGNKDKFKGIIENSVLDKLYRKWYYMLQRCYQEGSSNFEEYGKKGVFVCERWHSLENYISDVVKLPQYFIAKQRDFKGFDIDKDYYGSNCYSPETCVWLETGENLVYRNNPTAITLTTPNGEKEFFLSFADAEKKYNLSNLNKVVSGKRTDVRGFTAVKIEPKENEFFRYKISQNQVVDLINNIKNNPMSRRLMTSFWNDADVSEKALQECAMQTTWNVRDGKLDLLLYSRSVDTALGLPFNWIQYWFLLQLVAKSAGLKAGRFIHQMGNVHYYCRHEDKLMEQVNSDTYKQPIFNFTSENKDFFNFNIDDIEIKDYVNGGKFEYEVAI